MTAFDENAEIYSNLGQIRELNIRQNLLQNWSELWQQLHAHFPHVEILNVSNSRMNFDQAPSADYPHISQLVLIDTDGDCDSFEKICKYFPNLSTLHLDLNRVSFISGAFVSRVQHLSSLSLSDNPTLKSWDPFINRLGTLTKLEELILNNCAIGEIQFPADAGTDFFPALKYLYMSDNNIASFSSINELSRLRTLISFSVLRNPIYPSNPLESETAKQLIIARLPSLTHFNRVLITRDERRGAEIDYLQRHAHEYFEQKLDFTNEHRQYQKLIEKHGEPMKPSGAEVRMNSSRLACICAFRRRRKACASVRICSR